MTGDQAGQVSAVKAAIHRGETLAQIREQFAERAIMIAYGRDPESVCPYSGQGECA